MDRKTKRKIELANRIVVDCGYRPILWDERVRVCIGVAECDGKVCVIEITAMSNEGIDIIGEDGRKSRGMPLCVSGLPMMFPSGVWDGERDETDADGVIERLLVRVRPSEN